MSKAAVTLGYLDWGLRAFAIGFGAWIVVNAFARFDQLQQQRQEQPQQISATPSPSPSPEVSPSSVAMPELSPLAIEVSSWDSVTIGLWSDFCQQTRNGLGYGVKEQGICRALNEVR